MTCHSFWCQPWWQGVAGLFQVLASIGALITIVQARAALKVAEQQRLESVAPDWDPITAECPAHIGTSGRATFQVGIRNTGFGPAKGIHVTFVSLNGHSPTKLEPTYLPRTLAPEERFGVAVEIACDAAPDGFLEIRAATRFGTYVTRRIRISIVSRLPATIFYRVTSDGVAPTVNP